MCRYLQHFLRRRNRREEYPCFWRVNTLERVHALTQILATCTQGAKHVILTHFSSRFEKMIPDLRVYGDKASNIACALDGMEVREEMIGELPAVSMRLYDVLAAEYAGEEGEADE